MSRQRKDALRPLAYVALLLTCGCDDGSDPSADENAVRRAGTPADPMVVTDRGSMAPPPMTPPSSRPGPMPGPPPMAMPGPSNPPAMSGGDTSPAPAPRETIVRAKDIDADRVVAALIIAEKVEADAGRIEHVHKQAEKAWQTEIVDENLKVADLTAEVIYARSIKTTWIEAKQVFAREVRLEQGD